MVHCKKIVRYGTLLEYGQKWYTVQQMYDNILFVTYNKKNIYNIVY